MRRTDRSVFVSTAAQIANWDVRAREDGTHQNCVENGYFLRPPKLGMWIKHPQNHKTKGRILTSVSERPKSLWSSRFLTYVFYSNQNTKVITLARSICIAYEKGPQALGAYRAPTSREELLGVWREVSDDIRASWREQMQIQRHFISDFAAGHWRDAFYGRVEDKRKVRQRHGFIEREAEEGNIVAQFSLLLLHLNILGAPAARGGMTKSSNELELSVLRDE